MVADGGAVSAVRYQPDYRTDEARAAVAAREAVTGGMACMLAVRAGLVFALALAASAPVFADATHDPYMAVSRGTALEVSAAIAAGADPNARTESGKTPLHYAARDNEPSVVAARMEGGADPKARGARGMTPLHLAAWKNPEPSVVAALIAGGADPNARGPHGMTPLHLAAWKNPEPSVVAALIEGGADPSARDGRGRTPFDYAKDNEALRGTEVYRRLDEARFE